MRIGIYGGTFNPFHNGHLTLARTFLSEYELDAVWLMVSPQNPFKRNDVLLSDELRYKMVSQALQNEPCLQASNYEFSLPKPSYTRHTLQKLSADYPSHTFILLIGADNWRDFSKWYHADDILRHYEIAVFPRENVVLNASEMPRNVNILHAPLVNVSSTEIRNRVAKGLPIDGLVPTSVAQMIRQHKLYAHQ